MLGLANIGCSAVAREVAHGASIEQFHPSVALGDFVLSLDVGCRSIQGETRSQAPSYSVLENLAADSRCPTVEEQDAIGVMTRGHQPCAIYRVVSNHDA